jgi:hypothetical protein
MSVSGVAKVAVAALSFFFLSLFRLFNVTFSDSGYEMPHLVMKDFNAWIKYVIKRFYFKNYGLVIENFGRNIGVVCS